MHQRGSRDRDIERLAGALDRDANDRPWLPAQPLDGVDEGEPCDLFAVDAHDAISCVKTSAIGGIAR